MRRVLRINEANSRCRNLVDLTQKFKKILHDGGGGGAWGGTRFYNGSTGTKLKIVGEQLNKNNMLK